MGPVLVPLCAPHHSGSEHNTQMLVSSECTCQLDSAAALTVRSDMTMTCHQRFLRMQCRISKIPESTSRGTLGIQDFRGVKLRLMQLRFGHR